MSGGLPHLVDDRVAGGWPCRVWPADWTGRRARWLDAFRAAGPWTTAATMTSQVMAGTLYARYYDLPESWPAPTFKKRWGTPTGSRSCARRGRRRRARAAAVGRPRRRRSRGYRRIQR